MERTGMLIVGAGPTGLGAAWRLDQLGHRDHASHRRQRRVRRTDPGNPEDCPVWQFHLVYSDQPTRDWVVKGCTTAGIGCLDCKQPVIDAIIAEQEPIKERAQKYLDDPSLVRAIVADGCERARKLAEETMRDVREVMGLAYT